MVKYIVQAVLLLLLLLAVNANFAQQRLLTNQQHFGVEEGLPQSFISSIVQDDDGFLWMATLDGICRYDGRGFKSIRHNPKDSTSITANVINNFGRLQNNTVTIHYSQTQVDDFNLRTFKASRNKINDRMIKIPNARWTTYQVGVATANSVFRTRDNKGMGWLNNKTGRVYYVNRANGLLHRDTINAIVESAEGKLYLVSEDGVQVSNTSKSKFEWISFNTQVKNETPFAMANAYWEKFSIVYLPGNRLALGEKDNIILLDIDKKTSKVIPTPLPAISQIYSANSELKVDSRPGVLYE